VWSAASCGNDLNPDHRTQTRGQRDNRIAFRHLIQLAFQPFCPVSHFAHDILVFQDFQRRQTGCHCQLVAAEGTGVVARCPRIELLFDASTASGRPPPTALDLR
jgi:hypothetical protein